MELIIVLGIVALAVAGSRWLVTRHLDRERSRRTTIQPMRCAASPKRSPGKTSPSQGPGWGSTDDDRHADGLKVGPMEAGKPRALARQNPPRRWSQLGEQAQRNLAGFMDGDMRRGPVRVWIDEGK